MVPELGWAAALGGSRGAAGATRSGSEDNLNSELSGLLGRAVSGDCWVEVALVMVGAAASATSSGNCALRCEAPATPLRQGFSAPC